MFRKNSFLHIEECNVSLPYSANTDDKFASIAEQKRRELIGRLMGNDLSVNQIVGLVSWCEPTVSKGLSVLGHQASILPS